MSKKEIITVKGTAVTLFSKPDSQNYICITDIARYKNPVEPKDVVKNWMRNRTTIEFLGLWEKINNPDFKGGEFDPLWIESGSNSFTMSPSRWVETKDEIIPKLVTKNQISYTYANEADLLNVALLGKTAKEWRDENPNEKGNIRDYASLEQLVVLSNMESINALLIRQGLPQSERLVQLNSVAITQMRSLTSNRELKKL